LPGATDEPAPLVPRGAVAASERVALAHGAAVAVRRGLVRLHCTGPGRVACLQGLVTYDVESPGDGAHRFGALLTPKGMIVTTLWITRLGDTIHVAAPRVASGPLMHAFARTLPPRLCRFEDVTATTTTIGLYGTRARDVLAAAGGSTGQAQDGGAPGTGRAAWLAIAGVPVLAASVAARGVAGWDLVAPAEAEDAVLAALRTHGAAAAGPALLEERRILAGHPRVGAEVDDHTLPQEVRLDELGGVSFEKGCYVGQETVARLRFRGHANRRLMGLALGAAAPPSLPCEVRHDGRPVGRLTSAAWSERHDRYVGLAVLRREVPAGAAVLLDGDASAEVRDLPWEAP
jgi:folate-binding protein YgfZ